MELMILLIILIILLTIIIGYIVIRQNKKILDNQETITLELNKLLVAIKYHNE
ncbi:MAG: hypothetical protein K0R54_4532 [Clostridiaceae bacterium]|jgi:uncharacterized membrane-anchored protein YhcB (DUF1043 family)|nr:hypothetical protein [Clostridiaceae bacterium]